MKSRTLGQTNLRVTPMGLGLAALGRPGYINLGHAQDLNESYDVSAMEAHAHQVLDAAWEAGIRYFDAARSYGRAEAFLASWLQSRNIPAGAVAIGSKWGYTYTAGWQVKAEVHEVKEHSLTVLRRQIGESRTLLGNYLGLYQIHSATLDSGVFEDKSVLAELASLKNHGLGIGLSLSGAQQSDTLGRAMEIEHEGETLFDAVQATWNLLETSAGGALSEASAAGMGIIVKEALANGRLTTRNTEPSFQSKRKLLEGIAAELDTTIDALALAAVLAQPWVDVVLSGAAQPDQLQSNVAALAVKWGPETADRLGSLVESPAEYWATRSRLPWN